MGTRKLCRSSNRVLAGVCAGFANYFDIDPTLVRLLWLLFVLCGGSGVLFYIISWLVIPSEQKL